MSIFAYLHATAMVSLQLRVKGLQPHRPVALVLVSDPALELSCRQPCKCNVELKLEFFLMQLTGKICESVAGFGACSS